MRHVLRTLAGVSLAVTLAACGGGGDDDGSGAIPSATSASLSRTEVMITDTPNEAYSTSFVDVRIADAAEDELFISVRNSDEAIDAVSIAKQSPTRWRISIDFKPGVELGVGTHEDVVTVDVCHDSACTRHVQGSPLEIATTFTLIEPLSVTIESPTLDMDSLTTDLVAPTGTTQVLIDGPPTSGPFYETVSGDVGIALVSQAERTSDGQQFDVAFKPPKFVGAGVFEDDVSFKVCYDSGCTREIDGSPLQVHVTYTVTKHALAEPGVDPLEVTSRVGLTHNVIDAEYSDALDAVVMVSTWPQNALYVYDAGSGSEVEASLSLAPTAVSVTPDGLSAAVGHDGAITHFGDLSLVGTMGAPAPTLLTVSAEVHDLVLDGNGFVHAFPTAENPDGTHSVEVASNTETIAASAVNLDAHARLHPSGDFIYTADRGFSDLLKLDITTGAATFLYTSGHLGAYSHCTDLWLGETGDRIYTACGHLFVTSAIQAQDMAYEAQLELEPGPAPTLDPHHIQSLSDSAETQVMTSIEVPVVDCFSDQLYPDCHTHIATYDSTTLARTSLQSIPPVTLGEETFAEHGLFIFHNGDGTSRYLITRLAQMDDPATEYFFSVLP